MKNKKSITIQQDIEDGIEEVFEKMDKIFDEYFGNCNSFYPDCPGCRAQLIYNKFKKELWDSEVKKEIKEI